MKIAEEFINPVTLRQVDEDKYRIASEKDLREGNFLLSKGGLTKREYFAAHAISAACVISEGYKNGNNLIAKIAVDIADNILKELQNG
ncbi:hypothetical protein AGMMS49525_08630 [Bacteroidia bacterium]|nr:hypothetical protein AGMMS49525_08630 [Bacteroidia bacterium]